MKLYSPVISGSLTVTGSTTFIGNITMSGSLSATASNASLLNGTGSVGFTTTGSFATMSGSVSTRVSQIESVYATTGSNSFRATQSITGSLTVTGQIIAQTLNVQQVTSSIVFSSGSNTFGCDLNSRQTFTGSVNITGSLALIGNNTTITSTQNGLGGIQISNPSTGTSAYSGFMIGNNLSANGGGFALLGGNFPTSGPYTSDGAYIYSNRVGGLTIASEAGTLKFVTGTTIKATMTADGNLGLNETSPTNLLHLAGNVATPSLRLASTSTGFYWDIGRENQTTGDFVFNYKTPSTNSTEMVRIDTAGRFGIGVTPSGTYGKLTVAGGIRTTADSLSKLEIGRYNAGNPDSYMKLGSSSNRLIISNAADSADLFYFTNSGRFGLNRSPNTVFDVLGSNSGNALVHMQNSDNAGYSGIDFYRQGGVHAGSAWVANDSAGATNNRNALTIAARVAGEKLILVGGGYDPVVDGGLTVAGSVAKLEGNNPHHNINATSGLYAYVWLNNTAGGAGNSRTAYFIQNTAGSTANNVTAGAAYMYFGEGQNMEFSWAGSTKASITSAGVFNSVGGGTSDLRTKQNIDYNFDNGIESILKLQPTKFKFKIAPDKQRRGFIAQDVLEVIPDLVLGNGEIEGGTYGLDYDGVLAVAVKAIQEQQCTINALKSCLGIA